MVRMWKRQGSWGCGRQELPEETLILKWIDGLVDYWTDARNGASGFCDVFGFQARSHRENGERFLRLFALMRKISSRCRDGFLEGIPGTADYNQL